MNTDKSIRDILKRLETKGVANTRVAGNTLILYLDSQPGDDNSISFWIDPPWHLCGPDSVLIGSRQMQEETTEEELDEITRPLKHIQENDIETIEIEERTNDLIISFKNNFQIRTFAVNPEEDYSWYMTDKGNNLRVNGAPKGVTIEELKKNKSTHSG